MTTTLDFWRLDVLARGAGMVDTAMRQLNDANEARWLVHGVIMDAMTDMVGPVSRRALDGALNVALRDHAPQLA